MAGFQGARLPSLSIELKVSSVRYPENAKGQGEGIAVLALLFTEIFLCKRNTVS